MKIALYKRLDSFTYESIHAVEDYYESGEDWLRISEPIDVEFVPLPAEITVPKEVESLESQKKDIQAKYLTMIAALDEKISKLLAITHED